MLKPTTSLNGIACRGSSRSVLFGGALGGLLVSGLGAFPLSGTATLPLDPANATENTLDVGLTAVGTVAADLGFPLGNVDIPINASDSETSTLSGALLCDLDLEIDPNTYAATLQGISFLESPIFLDDDPSFNLNLGTYIFVPLGSVAVNGQNLVATAFTPLPPGSVSGTTFPLLPHEFRLNEGTITGTASGLAADFIAPIDIDLAVTPLIGPLGSGNGTVTISAPTVVGSQISYDVVVTASVDFAALVLTDPVSVTVAADGTVKASGTLTVEIPVVGPIEIVGVAAGSPTANDVTITWESAGGAASYRVLSSADLSTPMASWAVESLSVSNGGATTVFTDAGVLLTGGAKYYVIEEN